MIDGRLPLWAWAVGAAAAYLAMVFAAPRIQLSLDLREARKKYK